MNDRESITSAEGNPFRRCLIGLVTLLLVTLATFSPLAGYPLLAADSPSSLSPTLSPSPPPSFPQSELIRVLTLQDAQTRIVFFGTSLLGICGGLVGVFMLLRKRALIGDVVGHAALPGICIAFITCEVLAPGSGKNLPALATGAFISGLAGAVCVMLIDRFSPLRSDAAMAITLSLFYGFGAALFTVIQKIPTASAAGLSSYLNGKTASLVTADVWTFGIAALTLSLLVILLFKEIGLLCFDSDFAAATGWPVHALDSLLISVVVGVTIIGMQTVGLILVVAILIVPAASAQFWTDDLKRLMAISATLGAVAAGSGTIISALAPRLAAGPVIVLCGSALFLISLLIGPKHGYLWKWRGHRRLQAQIQRYDLLRAFYEHVEAEFSQNDVPESELIKHRMTSAELLTMRGWSPAECRRSISQAISAGLLEARSVDCYQLTPDGAALARRAVRNHRLWEIYLITNAETAPATADYDADRIEHVLGADLVRELEQRLAASEGTSIPASPHALQNPGSGSSPPTG